MLTPQQIQQVKSVNGVTSIPDGMPVKASQSAPLDDASFSSWAAPSIKPDVKESEDPNVIKIGNTKVIGGTAGSGLKKFGEGFNQVVEGVDLDNPDFSKVGRGILNQGAGAIETIISPLTAAFNGLTGGKFTDAMNFIQKDLESGQNKGVGGDILKMVSDSPAFQKFSMENPNAGEVFNNLMTIITSFMGGKEAGKLKVGGENFLDSTPGIIEKGKDIASNAKEIVSKIKDKALGTPTKEEALTKISQAPVEDASSFSKGMEHMGDTSKIKTYEELTKAAESTIKKTAEEQDMNLSKDTGTKRIADFEQNTNGVKSNYVETALKDLKDFYEKTNDAKGLVKINEYFKKANSEPSVDFATNEEAGGGLTAKDINDIAKLHGKDLSGFNTNGELSTGLTKQGAENTRAGLKTTVENTIKDPEMKKSFRNLDSKMSDVFTVKDFVSKEAEAVHKLSNKMENPNILQKISGLMGKAAKFTGFKAFLKEIGFGKEVNSSTLNAVEREARLPKLLEIVNEKTEKGFIDKLIKLYEETPNKEGGFAKIGEKNAQTEARDFFSNAMKEHSENKELFNQLSTLAGDIPKNSDSAIKAIMDYAKKLISDNK